MTFRMTFAALAAALSLSLPATAEEHPEGMHVHDVYARSMGQIGASGAVFFMMHNNTTTDDRLLSASADVAERVELHTHKEDANGVMQMLHVEEGFPLAAGEMHELARGGDHVMLLGLTRELKDGDSFPLTLTFEQAGEITVEAVVDNARKPGDGMMDHDHSGHGMEHGDASGAMQHDHSGHGHGDQAQSGHGHGGHDMAAMVDQTGLSDAEAVVAVMKAQFDTPENPLTVTPVVIEGAHALASWEQGGEGGRALLRKADMGWEIILCGGEDLRMPAFLGQHGVSGAEQLSALFNAEEDKLGSDKVALYSSFEGVVMVAGH
ncbi:MAG: copper uptake system-associated protein [Rhodobacteraceae bacterium]|nr:copper uptake system-associated protein [Paracoccaceae bacterium]